MPVTGILICANDTGSLESRLGMASQVARKFDTHLEVIFFSSAPAPITIAASPTLFDDSAARQVTVDTWDDEAAKATAKRRIFDRRLAAKTIISSEHSNQPRAEWSEVTGTSADLLPSSVRACDLIIAGGAEKTPSTLDDETSKIAFLSSGQMTLFAPPTGTPVADIFRSVLIAWEDSAAALRQIAQAMPLIMTAQEVTLFLGETSAGSATPCNAILA